MTARIWLQSLGAALVVASSWGAAAAEPADAALQWNEIAQQTVASANPLIQSRSMAIVHLAVLRAATAAVKDLPVTAADTDAQAIAVEVAVMAAAHDSLLALHPDAALALDDALSVGLAAVGDGGHRTDGIRIGRTAAAEILAARKADGWDAKISYEGSGGPGVWIPTPPKFAPALGTQWGRVTPFALKTGDQFRPAAPAAFDSAGYLTELHEVLELGAAESSARPPEKTDAAKFWVTSAVQGWNPAARQASLAEKRTLLENVRTFALLNVAIADSLIACFDAKYAHNRWRPVTAIRAGVGDIAAESDWQPLIVTPPFPAYPSAHACAAGAAQEVLERSFGLEGRPITLTSPAASGMTFHYTSFAAVADQIDDARVYGGIHTREDQVVGREVGRKTGRYVWETLGAAGL